MVAVKRTVPFDFASTDEATAARDAETLFRLGGRDYLTVLDANISLIGVDQSLAALNSKIANDQVNLFLALGGGWDTTDSNWTH